MEAEYQVSHSNTIHLLEEGFHFYVVEHVRVVQFEMDSGFSNQLSMSACMVL